MIQPKQPSLLLSNPSLKNPEGSQIPVPKVCLTALELTDPLHAPSSPKPLLLPASQVALVVKKPPAKAGDIKDVGFIPGPGRFPWRKKWQPTPAFLPGESPWTEEPGGLQSTWSQSQTQLKQFSTHTCIYPFPLGFLFHSGHHSASSRIPCATQ